MRNAARASSIALEEETFGPYVLDRVLGQGSYGTVRLARHCASGRQVAIKFINKSSLKKPSHVERVRREVRTMAMLRALDPARSIFVSLEKVYETSSQVVLVMEYVGGGELLTLINERGSLDEETARNIFRQLLSALATLHSASIIHRDLKPQNVLLSSDLRRIKLCDFGFTNTYDPCSLLDTFCGSPFYASPEMVSGTRYVGPEVDVWSLGVILYSMLAGRVPFNDSTIKGLYSKILHAPFDLPPGISPLASDLLFKMLSKSASSRSRLESLLDHPWITYSFQASSCIYIGQPCFSPLRTRLYSHANQLDPDILALLSLFSLDPLQAPHEITMNPRGQYACVYELLCLSQMAQQRSLSTASSNTSSNAGQRRKATFINRLSSRLLGGFFSRHGHHLPGRSSSLVSPYPHRPSAAPCGSILVPGEVDLLDPGEPDELAPKASLPALGLADGKALDSRDSILEELDEDAARFPLYLHGPSSNGNGNARTSKQLYPWETSLCL